MITQTILAVAAKQHSPEYHHKKWKHYDNLHHELDEKGGDAYDRFLKDHVYKGKPGEGKDHPDYKEAHKHWGASHKAEKQASHHKALYEKAAREAAPLNPNSTKGKLHKHLLDSGWKQTGKESHASKRRYAQRESGTDDWNAHLTNVVNEHHKFEKDDPKGEHAKALHKHLTSTLKFSHTRFKPWQQKRPYSKTGKVQKFPGYDAYSKGGHSVHVSRESGKTIVKHSSESTSPDREFERSGRGRGQII